MRVIIRSILIVMIILVSDAYCLTVGSDTNVSNQERIFFPHSDVDNLITGFTVVGRGITLEDQVTTCTFNAFFHVSGDMVLNAGSLVLNQNIEFKSPLRLSVGTFEGKNLTVLFPDNLSILKLPAENHDRVIMLQNQVAQASAVNSVSWTWDSQYIAVGRAVSVNDEELNVYFCVDNSLTLTASREVIVGINSVAFNPESYILAVGLDGAVDQLQTMSFDPLINQLSLIDTHTFSTAALSVDWHPTGTHLAVANQSSATVSVFGIEEGVIDPVLITGTLPNGSSPSLDAMRWHSSGLYLAVGLQNSLLGTEVSIFKFSGTALTLAGSTEIGGNVNDLDWRGESLMLTVGHGASGDRLQTFLYDPVAETLAEVESMQTGLQFEVFSVDWNSEGVDLVVGIEATENDNELITFHYEGADQQLSRVAGYSLNNIVNSARFTPTASTKIAAGDSTNLSLLSYDQTFPGGYALIFQDAKLFFKSDVQINASILLKGNCIMNGNNNSLDLNTTGSLVVDAGASLLLEDMTIKNIHDANIRAIDSGSVVTLQDIVWNQNGYTCFNQGSLSVKDDVRFEGGEIFAYSSSQPFTILQNTNYTLDQDCTFSYDPSTGSQTLVQFQDESSHWILNNSTVLTTATGMQLTKGNLLVQHDSAFLSQTLPFDTSILDNGITLGDGVTAANDLKVTILPGVELNHLEGSLNLNNTSPTNITLLNQLSMIHMHSRTLMRIKQDVTLNNGVLTFDANSQLGIVKGKTLQGSINPLGRLTRLQLSS